MTLFAPASYTPRDADLPRLIVRWVTASAQEWNRKSMSRMKTWRRIGIFALLGLLLSWVVSCSSRPDQSKSPEIEFWTMQLQPQFTEYFNKLISSFEAQNPGVKVRWVDVPWSAMETRILAAVSSKTAPDVVNLNPNFASQLASRNAWLDLDAKVPQAVRQEYLPCLLYTSPSPRD